MTEDRADGRGAQGRLGAAAIEDALTELDGWRFEDGALVRELELDSFRAAIDTIVRIADLAEAADHHPELTNVYARLRVALTSHDAGGVTDRDVALARAIDGMLADHR